MISDTRLDTSFGFDCCWNCRPRYTMTLDVLVLREKTQLVESAAFLFISSGHNSGSWTTCVGGVNSFCLCHLYSPHDFQEEALICPRHAATAGTSHGKGSELTPGNSELPSGPTGCWSGCPRRNACRLCADWPAMAKLPQELPRLPQSWCCVVRCRKLDRKDKLVTSNWGSPLKPEVWSSIRKPGRWRKAV